MVNLWRKYKNTPKRTKEALHSLIAGFLLFLGLFIITKFFPFSLCPIQNIFGVSCPGCGLTRAFIAIMSLDFNSAIKLHILSIPIFVGILLYAFFCLIDFFFEKNILEKLSFYLGKKYMLIVYLFILIFSMYINHII